MSSSGELRIYLDRSFGDPEHLAEWVLLDPDSNIRSSGNDLARVPSHQQCVVIVSDSLISNLKVELPKVSQRKLGRYYGIASQDQLFQPIEQIHQVVASDIEGISVLQTIDKAWLRRALDLLSEYRIRPVSIIPFSQLISEDKRWVVFRDHGVSSLRISSGMLLPWPTTESVPEYLDYLFENYSRPNGFVMVHTAEKFNIEPQMLESYTGVQVQESILDWRTSTPAPGVGMLTGKFAPRRVSIDWALYKKPLQKYVLWIVLVNFLGAIGYWFSLEFEKWQVESTITKTAARVLPAGAVIIDPTRQVDGEWDRLRSLAGESFNDSSLLDLSVLSASLPNGVFIESFSWQEGISTIETSRPMLDTIESAIHRDERFMVLRKDKNELIGQLVLKRK